MKKDIIIISIIIFLLFAILTVIIIKKEVRNKNIEKLAAKFLLEPYEENPEKQEEIVEDDLYVANRPDYIAFINEKGEEVFTLPKDKYDYIGEPYENRVLAAKVIGEYSTDNGYCYKKVKYTLYNKNGSIIKELDKNNYVISINLIDNYTLPSFYYSIAALELADGSYEYIDKNGNKISDKNTIINNRVYSECKKQDKCFFPNIEWIYFKKTMTSPYVYDTTCKSFGDYCFGYTKSNYNKNDWQIDSNKKVNNPDFVIIPQFNSLFAHSDWDFKNKDYHFYNGIATVVIDGKENKRYINQKGEFINNETYLYSEPFYRNLAFVIKKENNGTKEKKGFINKKGQWVYYWFVDIPKEEQRELNQETQISEKFSDYASYKQGSYSWEAIPCDNYAYVTESTNTNPDLLLKGDIITAINNYKFEGLSAEKIDYIFAATEKDCERTFHVKRNNGNFTIHTLNAQCKNSFDYDVNFDIYDNYVYVSQSSNIYYDKFLKGDVIISANNYDFQGLSAKEINNIWQSLKNEKQIYCRVKRGNAILTIIKNN